MNTVSHDPVCLNEQCRSFSAYTNLQLAQKDITINHLQSQLTAQRKELADCKAALRALDTRQDTRPITTRGVSPAAQAIITPERRCEPWDTSDSGISIDLSRHDEEQQHIISGPCPSTSSSARIPLRPRTTLVDCAGQNATSNKAFKTPMPVLRDSIPATSSLHRQRSSPTYQQNDHQNDRCTTRLGAQARIANPERMTSTTSAARQFGRPDTRSCQTTHTVQTSRVSRLSRPVTSKHFQTPVVAPSTISRHAARALPMSRQIERSPQHVEDSNRARFELGLFAYTPSRDSRLTTAGHATPMRRALH